VQHILKSRTTQLRDLILHKGANVYICGNASAMAKDVYKSFADILSETENEESELLADNYLEGMKNTGRWQEDVW
jgi:sulfite reductase alpha subunit-like flavoprotein